MWEDPIVAEVHRTREQLAAASNFDVTTFFADLRKRQAALGERLVHQKKRAEPTAETVGAGVWNRCNLTKSVPDTWAPRHPGPVTDPERYAMWRDLRNEAFLLTEPRCPCYCGGEGVLVLVACPACDTVMGRCDEVDELIRDVRNPAFDPDQSICYPEVPCPVCRAVPYGQFRAATEAELRALGLPSSWYRRWRA